MKIEDHEHNGLNALLALAILGVLVLLLSLVTAWGHIDWQDRQIDRLDWRVSHLEEMHPTGAHPEGEK
jgi:hypothetical protein